MGVDRALHRDSNNVNQLVLDCGKLHNLLAFTCAISTKTPTAPTRLQENNMEKEEARRVVMLERYDPPSLFD